jgi:phosphoribosylaminoimidazole-succinocarboxamide synthase
VLTGVSWFWFERLGAGAEGLPRVPHHLITTDASRIVAEAGLPPAKLPELAGRSMLVRRTEPIPVECVVRGFLEGSALVEYEAGGRVAGEKLPAGLRRGDRLRHPIFTPARKALSGHDENVTFDEVVATLGGALAETLRDVSRAIYAGAAALLEGRGLLLADTKFEFGLLPETAGSAAVGEPEAPGSNRAPLLIDEVLTPDSSRFWEASAWQPGRAQPSFDKQPLRDYLEDLTRRGLWDKRPPAPDLPDAVVRETAARYAEAQRRITGNLPEGWNPSAPEPVSERS